MPLSELRSGPLHIHKIENVQVAPGGSLDLCNLTGPGEVVSIWMALGGGAVPSLDGRIQVYYDNQSAPDIDIDVGTLFATHFGAGKTYGSVGAGHVHAQINANNLNSGFFFNFPMPFQGQCRITYHNINSGVTANAYSMVTYSLTDPGVSYRLRCQGARWADQAVIRSAGDTVPLLDTSGGPGWIVYHAQVGGINATNLSWLERNFAIYIDGESNPSLLATGTEDWFDSAWYYEQWKDFQTSAHSFVRTDVPTSNPNACGMATDFLSKWGGVPFTNSAHMQVNAEPACTTGDHFCYCVLYYR